MNRKVLRITRLAVLLALSVVISYFESFIPIPIPGVKLGIANVINLLVLYLYSIPEFVLIGLLRVLIVGLIRGSLISFLFSFTGYALSTIVVIIFYLCKKGSIFGLSIASAISHSLGQIIVCMIIYKASIFVNYLPFLLITSIISGTLVALLASVVLSRLKNLLIE